MQRNNDGLKTMLLCALASLAVAVLYGCAARLILHAPPVVAVGVGIGSFITGIIGLSLVIRYKGEPQ